MKVNNYENVDLVASFFSEEEAKVNQMNDFIKNNGLGSTNFIVDFLSMVEFSGTPIDDIMPRNYMSDFMVNVLKAFEEFDQNLNPPGLITKQFEAIAQKCKEKGVKLLIGEKISSTIMGCDPTGFIQDKYVHINFSENMVKQMLKTPIYIVQQEDNTIPEIKVIPLGKLVAKDENVDLDNPSPTLIAKCAAYLLFHELFHANTNICFDFQDINTYETFIKDHPMAENLKNALKFFEINNLLNGDDIRNTLNFTKQGETRIPGEFELLAALYSDRLIRRLYNGAQLNFSDPEVIKSCMTMVNPQKINSEENLVQTIIEQSLQNIGIGFYMGYLICKMNNDLNQQNETLLNEFKDVTQLIEQIKNEDFCNLENTIKSNLKVEENFYNVDIIFLRNYLLELSNTYKIFYDIKVLNEDTIKLARKQISDTIDLKKPFEKAVLLRNTLRDLMSKNLSISEEKLLNFFNACSIFPQDFEIILTKIKNLDKAENKFLGGKNKKIFEEEINKIINQIEDYIDLFTKPFCYKRENVDNVNNLPLIRIDNSVLENFKIYTPSQIRPMTSYV